MTFQQQIGAGSGIEGCGCLGLDCLLCFAVVDTVVFALPAGEESDEDVGAVGWDGGDGREVGEEKNAVHARIRDVGKFFEILSYLIQRTAKRCVEIAVKLAGDTQCDLFESGCA